MSISSWRKFLPGKIGQLALLCKILYVDNYIFVLLSNFETYFCVTQIWLRFASSKIDAFYFVQNWLNFALSKIDYVFHCFPCSKIDYAFHVPKLNTFSLLQNWLRFSCSKIDYVFLKGPVFFFFGIRLKNGFSWNIPTHQFLLSCFFSRFAKKTK